jgi:YD repeat-containing protein
MYGATLMLVAAGFASLAGCCSCPSELTPTPGMCEYQEPAFAEVPGGLVNTIGRNLLVRRVDLSIDTHLGTFDVGAVWNSALNLWTWSFDSIAYLNGTFLDETGAVHNVAALAAGQAVPGTSWVKLDATTMKTRGGLRYQFAANGRPQNVRWTSATLPRLDFVQATQGDGQLHTSRIDQCPGGGGACTAVFTFAYDATGKPTSITDRAGRVAQFTWTSGRLTVARDALDIAQGLPGFRYEYGGGPLSAIVNSENERVEFTWAGGRLATALRKGLPTGDLVYTLAGFAPDASGFYRTEITDPVGGKTTWRYDGLRRLRQRVDAVGGIWTWTYNTGGADGTGGLRPDVATLPSGVQTRFTYENDDVKTKEYPWNEPVAANRNLTTWTYNANGVDREKPRTRAVLTVADKLGSVETRSYDGAGRLTGIANGVGVGRTFAYGNKELVTQVVTETGSVIDFSGFEEHGHPTTVNVGGQASNQVFDLVGNLEKGPGMGPYDAPAEIGLDAGGVVARTFDADRNLATVQLANLVMADGTSSNTEILSIQRRSDGRHKLITRPYGGNTEFVYDAAGRLTQIRETSTGAGWASPQTTTLEYDGAGRRIRTVRPNGFRKVFTYDLAGHRTALRLYQGAELAGNLQRQMLWTWAADRPATTSDGSWGAGSETFSYDTGGRLSGVTFQGGERLDQGWDLRSRRASADYRTAPGGTLLAAVDWQYDLADREIRVLVGGVEVLERTYNQERLTNISHANGLNRNYTWLADTPLYSTVTGVVSGNTRESTSITAFGDLDYVYLFHSTDSNGLVDQVTSDDAYLMSPVPAGLGVNDRAGPRLWATDIWQFSQDELANVIVAWDGSNTQFSYNAQRNRLLSTDGDFDHTYAYDAAGFVTSRDGVALTWWPNDLIKSIGADSFAWDAIGRRVSKTVSGVTTRYRFGGDVDADASGTVFRYLDLGHLRLDLQSGTRLYRHFDYRGNVKLLSNDSGQISKHYAYDALGRVQVFGSEVDAMDFAGGVPVGDLTLIGVRVYDGDVGRFLGPDPDPSLVNQYAVNNGNPIGIRPVAGDAAPWTSRVREGLDDPRDDEGDGF